MRTVLNWLRTSGLAAVALVGAMATNAMAGIVTIKPSFKRPPRNPEMQFLRIAVIAVFAFTPIFTSNLSAGVILLFSNTNGGSIAIGTPSSSQSLATSDRGITFTVGNNDITLNQATFGLYANAAGTANVGLRLYAGAAVSGTALQQVNQSTVSLNTIASGGTLTTFVTSGWTLSSNTQYTVAVFGSAGTTTPRVGISSLSSGSWTSSGLTFNQFTASTTPGNYHVELSGSVSGGAVPEPTSMAIFGLGALGFAYRNRRKLMK